LPVASGLPLTVNISLIWGKDPAEFQRFYQEQSDSLLCQYAINDALRIDLKK
jgi:hypothetical protein